MPYLPQGLFVPSSMQPNMERVSTINNRKYHAAESAATNSCPNVSDLRK